MIEVEAPDGSIVEFPDDTPKDVMSSAMRKKFSVTPDAAPQPPSSTGAPNRELADKLYDDHFALTMSRGDFYDQVGLNKESEEVRPPGVGSALKRMPAEFNRGIGNTLEAAGRFPAMVVDAPVNAIVDPVNAALNYAGVDRQLPRSDTYGAVEQLMEPVEQSAFGKAAVNFLQGLGDRWAPQQPEPKNAGERIADYTAGLVGSTVPFMAAPYLRAGKAVTAANSPSVTGRILQDMQRRAATQPVSTALLETGSAAGAGLGGGIAQEAAPGNKWAELLGQILGGVGPGFMPTVVGGKLLVGGIKNAREYVSGSAQTRRAEQKIRDTVGDLSDVGPKLREADIVERRVNEAAARDGTAARMKLSLGERTQSPAIAAAQRDVESRYSGTQLNESVARREGNQDAISAFAREIEPKGGKVPDDVVEAAAAPGKRVQGVLDQQVTRNLLEREALARKVPTIDLAEKGRLLRSELENQRLAVRDRFNKRAAAEGLNEIDVSLDFRNFQAKVAEDYALETFDNPLYRPPVLNDIERFGAPDTAEDIGKVINTGLLDDRGRPITRTVEAPEKMTSQPITFQDVKRLRERITTDLRVARRSDNPAERERAATLSRVLKDFDDMIVNSELAIEAPEIAAKWKAFRKDYKEQFVDVFRPPQVRDIQSADLHGFDQMADEAVAAAVFKPGNVTMARRFKEAIRAGGDDAARVRTMDAIEAVAMDSLNKAAVRTGTVNPKALEAWKRQHQSVLEEFPFIRSQVDSIEAANNSLLARTAQLEARKKAVEKSVMERKLASVESGAKTPEALIDEAVRSHAIASRLVIRLRGDKAALNGLRQAVWERMPLGDPDATIRFLVDHKRSLDAIFEPNHIADLRMIAQARAMASTVHPPTGKPIETSPFAGIEKAIGSTLPSLAASARAVRMGRSGLAYEVPARGLQWWRAMTNARADKVWQQALYDPDVARAILHAQNSTNSLAQEKLRRMLWSHGLSLAPDAPNARLPGGYIQMEKEE